MSSPEPQRPRDRARDDFDELARLLPVLDVDAPALRHRHRSRGVLSDDELEQQLAVYFEQRAAVRVYVGGKLRTASREAPPGPSRLPIDLRAAQLRRQITAELHKLEYDTAIALNTTDTYEQRSTDLARVRRLRRMLRRLHVKPGLEEQTADRAAAIVQLARDALDPPALSQLGACPWCGFDTLEVDHAAETITCTWRHCRCTRSDCPSCQPKPGRPRSLHAWPRPEWEALAQLCKTADAARENQRMRNDLVEWIRQRFAARETELRRQLFDAAPAGYRNPALTAELEQIEEQRRGLSEMTDDDLRALATTFADEPGYREEWRP
ncbi:MAG TPA: hypothetical protein VN738_03605 [Acidothermaceae bacterium]|nr:hypothetical protein [Acidothermaceae bacterium]